MNNIPEIINNFNIYKDGARLIGISDEVTLADYEAITETISGAGIAGEYEVVNPGHFSSMEQEIPFRVLYGDIYELINPLEPVALTLRGSLQVTDGNGNKKFVGMRYIVKGACKKITGGSAKPGSPMSCSVTIETTYSKIEIDGKTKLELDKLNSIFKVNGTDVMSKIASLC